MGILEQIGQLNIFYIIIPLILIILLIHKIKKGRKSMKEQKPQPVKTSIEQPDIVEPATISDLKIDTTPKVVKPKPQVPSPIEGEEMIWIRIFGALGVIALFIFSLGFVWGVANDKFKSVSNVDTDFPEIKIPECTQPDIPDCICDTSLICPNISVESPIVNVFYNLTQNSTNSTL